MTGEMRRRNETTGLPRSRLGVVGLALTATACAGEAPDFAARRGEHVYNALVVTVDTIRADRVGAYGFQDVETPVMDSLADEGILFEAAYGPTPLTLPSHTSLMTGTYPVHHGVRDNGGFVVPEDLETLAELFQSNGYRTGGFVSAYVLDARWGLDQGFDAYYDEFDVTGQRVVAMGGVQRPADEVIDEAIAWLDDGEGPFFLWVHLYDPHAPYEPPEPYRSLYAGRPYLGEIAFTDSQIGRLLEHVEERGERDRTFVALAGDHGESLGEHGEVQHGLFVYEGAIRVPLIFWTPFDAYRGVRRAEPVSLVDVAPTLLEMTGIPVPRRAHGASLVSRFDPRTEVEAPPVYSESWYGRLHYGWSDLRALIDGTTKLIESSEPELYDLQDDPGEERDLSRVRNTEYVRMLHQPAQKIAPTADAQ